MVSLTVGLALAGCSAAADGEAAPAPSAPSVQSAPSGTAGRAATPTPTGPTPPARPADWLRSDERGARAATEYLVDLMNYGLATGDSTELRRWTTKLCGFCNNLIEGVDQVKAGEAKQIDGDMTIKIHSVTPGEAIDGSFLLRGTAHQEEGTWTEKGSKPHQDGGEFTFIAEVLWGSKHNDGWRWLTFKTTKQ